MSKAAKLDETSELLKSTYKMDLDIWEKSKRGFPFSIPLNLVVYLAFATPLVQITASLDLRNTYLAKVFFSTLAISVVAYLIADRFIEIFKESMVKANLFGKDLNKAGKKEEKPPV